MEGRAKRDIRAVAAMSDDGILLKVVTIMVTIRPAGDQYETVEPQTQHLYRR